MASIIKCKKNYSVVYNYVDENGETKQKWETWRTHKDALRRKAEIENQQLREPSCRRVTRKYPSFCMTSFLCMEKRSGAYPCMTARQR